MSVLAQRILGHRDAEPHSGIGAALVSALTGEGHERLLTLIDAALPFDTVRTERFQIPLAAGADIALLHSSARVMREEYNEVSCEIEAEVPDSIREKLDDQAIYACHFQRISGRTLHLL